MTLCRMNKHFDMEYHASWSPVDVFRKRSKLFLLFFQGKDKENKVANMKDRAKQVLSLGKTYSYIPQLKKMSVSYTHLTLPTILLV